MLDEMGLTTNFPKSLVNLGIFLLILLIHRNVPRIFFKQKFKLFTSSFIGLSINAAILTLAVSVNMKLAHSYLYIVLIMLGTAEVILLFRNFRKASNIFRSLETQFFSLLLLICAYLVGVLSFSLRNVFVVNAHWSYYMGLPLEILKGNYPSRLKIFDNFPVEYPKYHFFGSSELAIVLRPLRNLQFADFAIARIFLLALFICVLFERLSNSWGTRKSIIVVNSALALCLTSLAPNTFWAINSTNYFAIGFFTLFIVAYISGALTECLIWLGFFSISTARSILPAFIIFFWIIFTEYKSRKRYELSLIKKSSIDLRNLGFGCVVLLNWFFMLFTGKSDQNLDFRSLFDLFSIPYQNLINAGWLVIMSPPIFVGGKHNFSSSEVIPTTYLWPYLILLTLTCISFLVHRDFRSRAFLYFLLLSFVGFSLNLDLVHPAKSLQIQSLLFCFFIPACAVEGLSQGRMKILARVFLASSFVIVVTTPPDFGIPNWALVEFLWLALLILSLNDFITKWNHVFILVVLNFILLAFLPSQVEFERWFQPSGADSTTHGFTSRDLAFQAGLVCKYEDLSGLLNSLSGNRTFYYSQKSDRFSVTVNFVRDQQSENLPNC